MQLDPITEYILEKNKQLKEVAMKKESESGIKGINLTKLRKSNRWSQYEDSVKRLWKIAQIEDNKYVPKQLDKANISDSRFEKLIDDKYITVVGVTDNNKLVAMVAIDLHNEPPIAILYDLIVDPKERRKGYGTKLIEEATKEVKKHPGYYYLTLGVWHNNKNARAFYNKHGFKPYMHWMRKKI